MTIEEIKNLIVQTMGEGVVLDIEETGLQPAIQVHPDRIAEVCMLLRDNEHTYFDFLSSLSGVDYGLEENYFGVVYHLASIPYKTQLTLKVKKYHDRSTQELPSFPSVYSVWRTAEWHERETYDLMGICFEGHPDLRRILLPDDWEGYPLRKDYKAQEYYHGIKVD